MTMALVLKGGSVFLHIPKTGGTWVRSILSEMSLAGGKRGHKHIDFDGLLRAELERWGPLAPVYKGVKSLGKRLKKWPEKPSFKFCFVRHPLAWYESHWKFSARLDKGWKFWGQANSRVYWHPTVELNPLGSMDFNEFMWNVIRRRPGFVTELFYSYTKPGINFIGRNEHLSRDLQAVLEVLQLPFREETLQARSSVSVNVSKRSRSELEWDPALKKEVMRLELPALLQFGYLSDEEKEEFGVKAAIPPHPALYLG
jgi:hypothetical protein